MNISLKKKCPCIFLQLKNQILNLGQYEEDIYDDEGFPTTELWKYFIVISIQLNEIVFAITPTTFKRIQTIHQKACWRDVHAWETVKTPRSLSKEPIRTQLPRDYTLQKRPAENVNPFWKKVFITLGPEAEIRQKGRKKFQ